MQNAHLILRQWRQRPARAALSILSVAIAVAGVVGVSLAQSTVRAGFRSLLQAVGGRPALEIVAAEGGRFSRDLVATLKDIPGVTAVTPLATRAALVRVNGKRIRGVVVGIPEDDDGRASLPVIQGRAIERAGEAMMSADLAKSLEIKVGDRIVVLAYGKPPTAKIVGLVDSVPLAELAPAATIVMSLSTVQQAYRLGNQVDRVQILLESPEVRETVAAILAARLPEELVVQTPVAQWELAGGILRSTELALRFAGSLSIVTALFVLLNSLRMNFGERRRDMAVLRVLGMTKFQLARLQLAEGFVIGLVGSLLGAPAGVALGRGLAGLMQRLAGIQIDSPQISYGMIAVAVVATPVISALAALVPAIQSRHVAPGEALGEPELRRGEHFPWLAVVGGVVVWAMAVTLLILVQLERVSAEAAIPAGVLMLVGFIAVIPALLVPVLRILRAQLNRRAQMEGSFAADQLLHRLTRSCLTVGILVVATSTCVGLGNAIANNVHDVRSWYRRMTVGDIFVASPAAGQTAGDSPEMSARETILTQPGVDHVVETRYVPARVDGVPVTCVIHDFAPRMELPWAMSAADDERTRRALKDGKAVIAGIVAKRLGLQEGDSLRLEVQGRVLPVQIAQVVRDYTMGGLAVYLDQESAAKSIDIGLPQIYTLYVQEHASLEPLVEQLRTVLANEGFVIESFAKVRGDLDLLIGTIVASLWGLLIVGFLVGGMAVANTLSMSVLEQTHELGLMRIIGMTPAQVRKMILWQSLLLGSFGTLFGVKAGLTTAWIIHLCNEPLLGQVLPFDLHGWLLAASAAGTIVVALLAAWWPSERAARLDLLAAVACE